MQLKLFGPPKSVLEDSPQSRAIDEVIDKINYIDKQVTMSDKDLIVSMYDSVAPKSEYE